MAEHTPTPWGIIGTTRQGCPVVAAGLDPIAHVHNGSDRSQADAEFIVRAVNSHDELLAACQMALHKLRRMTTEEFRLGGDHAVREALRDAIHKATGEMP